MSQAKAVHQGLGEMAQYLKELAKTPLLTRDEELNLARRAFQGDAEARQLMVLHNLRFVVRIARKMRPHGQSLADLVAEGNLGLARAAEGFDPDKGVRFTTYAAYWIKEKIQRYLALLGGAISLPEKKLRTVRRLEATKRRMLSEQSQNPVEEDVLKAVGVSAEEAMRVCAAARRPACLDGIQEPATEMLEHQQARRELQGDVERLLGALPARERQCIRLYFGLNGDPPRNFREIGGLLSLGKEGTRQVFQRGLKRLRKLPQTDAFRFEWAA